MSTRGFIGVRYRGKDYLQYTHSDGYPTWLGREMLKAVQTVPLEVFRHAAASWVLVDAQDEPTEAQWIALHAVHAMPGETLEAFRTRTSERPHGGSDVSWYKVLRDLQGELATWVTKRIPVWPQAESSWLFDRSCEWGYLVNTDEETLEIYAGDSHYAGRDRKRPVADRPASAGRYATSDQALGESEPVWLIATLPMADLLDLPDTAAQAWLVALQARAAYAA